MAFIAFAALLVAFTGFRLPDVINVAQSVTKRSQPETVLVQLTAAKPFAPIRLETSDIYYYLLELKFQAAKSSGVPSFDEDSSVIFEVQGQKIGKATIDYPLLVVYILDPLSNLRGQREVTLRPQEETIKLLMQYGPLPKGERALGHWKAIVLLKESRSGGQLVSYAVREFLISEPEPRVFGLPVEGLPLIVFGGALILIVYVGDHLVSRWRLSSKKGRQHRASGKDRLY